MITLYKRIFRIFDFLIEVSESLSQVLLVDGEGPGDPELVPPEAAVHPLRRLGRVGERPPRRLAQDVLPRVRLRERV